MNAILENREARRAREAFVLKGVFEVVLGEAPAVGGPRHAGDELFRTASEEPVVGEGPVGMVSAPPLGLEAAPLELLDELGQVLASRT